MSLAETEHGLLWKGRFVIGRSTNKRRNDENLAWDCEKNVMRALIPH
jgi:hypothetical protein